MNIGEYKGYQTIAFGIMDMRNYNKKEIIQKASYYWAGIQYERCNDCVFYSGEYFLEPFTEELSKIDILQFMNKWIKEAEIRKRYKYVFVRVVEENNHGISVYR